MTFAGHPRLVALFSALRHRTPRCLAGSCGHRCARSGALCKRGADAIVAHSRAKRREMPRLLGANRRASKLLEAWIVQNGPIRLSRSRAKRRYKVIKDGDGELLDGLAGRIGVEIIHGHSSVRRPFLW